MKGSCEFHLSFTIRTYPCGSICITNVNSYSLISSCSSTQPSIYLRLLENPCVVTPQNSFFLSSKSSRPQSGYSRSPSPSRSKSPLSRPHSPSPSFPEHYHPECTSPHLTTSHFSASDVDHSSERSEKSVQQVNFMHVF